MLDEKTCQPSAAGVAKQHVIDSPLSSNKAHRRSALSCDNAAAYVEGIGTQPGSQSIYFTCEGDTRTFFVTLPDEGVSSGNLPNMLISQVSELSKVSNTSDLNVLDSLTKTYVETSEVTTNPRTMDIHLDLSGHADVITQHEPPKLKPRAHNTPFSSDAKSLLSTMAVEQANTARKNRVGVGCDSSSAPAVPCQNTDSSLKHSQFHVQAGCLLDYHSQTLLFPVNRTESGADSNSLSSENFCAKLRTSRQYHADSSKGLLLNSKTSNLEEIPPHREMLRSAQNVEDIPITPRNKLDLLSESAKESRSQHEGLWTCRSSSKAVNATHHVDISQPTHTLDTGSVNIVDEVLQHIGISNMHCCDIPLKSSLNNVGVSKVDPSVDLLLQQELSNTEEAPNIHGFVPPGNSSVAHAFENGAIDTLDEVSPQVGSPNVLCCDITLKSSLSNVDVSKVDPSLDFPSQQELSNTEEAPNINEFVPNGCNNLILNEMIGLLPSEENDTPAACGEGAPLAEGHDTANYNSSSKLRKTTKVENARTYPNDVIVSADEAESELWPEAHEPSIAGGSLQQTDADSMGLCIRYGSLARHRSDSNSSFSHNSQSRSARAGSVSLSSEVSNDNVFQLLL